MCISKVFFRLHVYTHLKHDTGFWEHRLQYLKKVDARFVKYECDLCPYNISGDSEIPSMEMQTKRYENYNLKILYS